MVNFTTFIYLSCIVLILNLRTVVRLRNPELKHIVVTNSVFAVSVSTLSLYYGGVYVDENNLVGDSGDFSIAIVNIIIFIIIWFYSIIKLNKVRGE